VKREIGHCLTVPYVLQYSGLVMATPTIPSWWAHLAMQETTRNSCNGENALERVGVPNDWMQAVLLGGND